MKQRLAESASWVFRVLLGTQTEPNLEIFARDDMVETIVKTIARAAHTGNQPAVDCLTTYASSTTEEFNVRVLVIEDDAKIASFIVNGLKQAGFVTDMAANGEDGFRRASTEHYDAAIVDLMLPKLDGLSLIEELRRQEINTPVIILSAKRSVDDRVKGLQAGGDDYMVKPFSFSELLARLQALLRRAAGTAGGEQTRLAVGDLSINLLSREVLREGKKLDLQAREFSLLEYLMRNTGRVVSKTMILEHVWDYSFDPQTNVVDVLVCRLRNKVDRNFKTKMIHTIRGVGYVVRAF